MLKQPEDQIRSRIRSVVLELAPNPEGAAANDPRLIEDLDYHSLALLELGFTLEDEFDLPPVDHESVQHVTTVRAVEDYVVDAMSAA